MSDTANGPSIGLIQNKQKNLPFARFHNDVRNFGDAKILSTTSLCVQLS